MKHFKPIYYYFTIPLLIICACNFNKTKNEFDEYTETKSGLRYHRITIGEGKNYPQEGDFLKLQLQFRTIDDSILPITIFKNENREDTLHFSEAKRTIQFYEALGLLSEGDSCSFIVATNLFKDTTAFKGISSIVQNHSFIKLNAKLVSIRTQEQQHEDLLNYYRVCQELAQDEKIELQNYITTNEYFKNSLPDEHGMYFKLMRRGTNKAVKSGDNITLRYTGSFLNGDVFDNSTYLKEALNFNLGEPGQVVRGIELALHKMHEGDSAVIVLPSSLAFGEKGSAAGIVSPYKTVTFALEILKIN